MLATALQRLREDEEVRVIAVFVAVFSYTAGFLAGFLIGQQGPADEPPAEASDVPRTGHEPATG